MGWTRLEWRDAERERPLWADLWYPVAPDVAERPKHYVLTRGQVAEDAPIASNLIEKLPVVVLSHGSNGSAEDYSWLSETLAAHGYAVLGINHYGESRVYGVGSLDSKAALRVWERPRDIVFGVRQLERDPAFAPHLSTDWLYAVGHSAGGFSVVAAAGAHFDLERLRVYCNQADPERDKGCRYGREYGPVRVPEAPAPAETLRFRAMLLLDPAIGPIFADTDLQSVDLPVQIVATDPGDFIPFGPHAGHYASELPRASLTKLDPRAGHFVFLGDCSLGIEVFGVPLCNDAPGVDRDQVHDRIIRLALDFFERPGQTQRPADVP